MSKAPFFSLRSEALETEYLIFQHTPAPPESPLVVVLDGDDQFAPAQQAIDEGKKDGTLPALNLIGVGYGGSYRSPKNRRARDYTPTQPKDETMTTGGAAGFHAFLTEAVIPEVIRRNGATPRSLALMGHSLGSLFVLYALAQPKPFFDHHLVSSPSLWWDERSVLKQVEVTQGMPAPKPLRAYFSVGEKDSPSMSTDLVLLEEMLKKQPRPNVKSTFEHFPGLDHYDALPAAFQEGLRWLYRA